MNYKGSFVNLFLQIIISSSLYLPNLKSRNILFLHELFNEARSCSVITMINAQDVALYIYCTMKTWFQIYFLNAYTISNEFQFCRFMLLTIFQKYANVKKSKIMHLQKWNLFLNMKVLSIPQDEYFRVGWQETNMEKTFSHVSWRAESNFSLHLAVYRKSESPSQV